MKNDKSHQNCHSILLLLVYVSQFLLVVLARFPFGGKNEKNKIPKKLSQDSIRIAYNGGPDSGSFLKVKNEANI